MLNSCQHHVRWVLSKFCQSLPSHHQLRLQLRPELWWSCRMPCTAIRAKLQQGWRERGMSKKGGKYDPGLCLSPEKSLDSEPEGISGGCMYLRIGQCCGVICGWKGNQPGYALRIRCLANRLIKIFFFLLNLPDISHSQDTCKVLG